MNFEGQKLLVIRNDKLGDFMLIFPALAMLKKSAPKLQLIALVPAYTAPIAQNCPYLDGVILDPGKQASKQAKRDLLARIKDHHFDYAINFFSNAYNALLVWRAKIPHRLAPATKWVQIFYTHRLTQRRSRSLKPEFEYNLDLVRFFLKQRGVLTIEPQAPFWVLNPDVLTRQREKLAQELGLSAKPWVFLHAGSGGSAPTLTLEQYAHLANTLLEHFTIDLILSAGPTEGALAHQLVKMITKPVVVYESRQGLLDFAHSLACARLLICGSTGPLHLGAAFNVPTLAFYPSHATSSALRWQPTNTAHLSFSSPVTPANDLSGLKIPLSQVLEFVQGVLTPTAP
ncbi:glycosyltransferase family 9 protein [Helicobacter mehlei]|uniref:Glycosyltransferase family 9 protein n=1 Tax=Helicobacter mehlei TaxID=2316080 RepID=A0A553V0Q6_9HELI|nr:glycosyltransferase family 9 protein [Helicobacter mehlei]TSA86033.1 glycosyltransferase family 9 protein [Helicobacter mehlei]